jgi:ABC-type transporter Mla MlaB component
MAMTSLGIPLPVRPGEHACCRFAFADDREQLTIVFIRAGLDRGHKVVYMCVSPDDHGFAERLKAADARAAAALASGQLELRPAGAAYLPDGRFEPDEMNATLHEEHARALAAGYTGISITGDVSAISGAPGCEHLTRYEHQLDGEPPETSQLFLCQYPPDRFSFGELAEIAACHDVDVSPELAPIGRDGMVFAARVRSTEALRLAGELDFGGAPVLADVLAAHFHGPLRLDLADLAYVDVAGMRALRGRTGQTLRIDDASEAVRRLVELLAWDTDPDVELPAAA